jgi:hypothetical protein
VEDVPEPPGLCIRGLACEQRRILEQRGGDEAEVLGEPPGDDAAERVPDDDHRPRLDRAQHGHDVGAVAWEKIRAGCVV